jgi:hypothetical protein
MINAAKVDFLRHKNKIFPVLKDEGTHGTVGDPQVYPSISKAKKASRDLQKTGKVLRVLHGD